MLYSRKSFTPSKKSASSRAINYVAVYNSLFPNSQQLICEACAFPQSYTKFLVGSDSPSQRVSKNRIISHVVNYSKGGKTQYGNFYLGQPLNLNYLGRMEGMPGGSGTAPKNKFN